MFDMKKNLINMHPYNYIIFTSSDIKSLQNFVILFKNVISVNTRSKYTKYN